MSQADVLILGGGLVGLSLAVALERHGVTSIVVDAAEPASQIAPAFDGRATAAPRARGTGLTIYEGRVKAASRRLGVALLGVGLSAAAVLLLLAIISYRPSDPSLNTREALGDLVRSRLNLPTED